MISSVKIFLIVILLACLFKMPYGYYQFIRLASAAGFIFLANESADNKNRIWLYIYISLAILFQPIIKFSLGRDMWNIVDIVVAVFLIFSLFSGKKLTKNNNN